MIILSNKSLSIKFIINKTINTNLKIFKIILSKNINTMISYLELISILQTYLININKIQILNIKFLKLIIKFF